MGITKTDIKGWSKALAEIEGKLRDIFEEISAEVSDLPDDTERQQEKRDNWQAIADQIETAVSELEAAIGAIDELP